MTAPYTRDFYELRKSGARQSARAIVPLLLERLQPRSVVDVGCGTGVWLSVFQELGVQTILGVDGRYVDRASLEIAPDCFQAANLAETLVLPRTFDLVMSLEVAEHLPAAAAEGFIRSLTRLGPAVLFSAAIPFQGGTGHVNEQWPAYWTRLFAQHDFVPLDWLRAEVWENAEVDWWYAQNLLLFVARKYLDTHPALPCAPQSSGRNPLPLVHPRNYLRWAARGQSNRDYTARLAALAHDLARLVPPDTSIVVVDEEQCREFLSSRFRCLPFLERHGEYWGPPPDNRTALEELNRMRGAGARFIAFAWPAFWWLDHYREFHRHLRETFRCVLENPEVVLFAFDSVSDGQRKAAP